MSSNITAVTSILTLQPLQIPPSGLYPSFIFSILTYCIIVFFNLTLLITIALNRDLHKPMHLLLINLPINDMIGATAFFPQLISSILSQDRIISYPACFLQALLAHLYGTGSLLILTAMAFDRYIAICCPLRYNSIMSNSNVTKIIICLWLADYVMIAVLFLLLIRFNICRTVIVDMYCNNPSLMKLICEDTRINNYYGLFLTIFLQCGSLSAVIFTYCQILLTCLMNRQSDTKSKAIQTCASHLVVFIFLEFNAMFTLISHRFEQTSPFLRRFCLEPSRFTRFESRAHAQYEILTLWNPFPRIDVDVKERFLQNNRYVSLYVICYIMYVVLFPG
uniref:Olfactory receptor n=1 Tax=Scleropages formosus TaxID=113540 RepID=A0A8C9R4M2_SCLFO